MKTDIKFAVWDQADGNAHAYPGNVQRPALRRSKDNVFVDRDDLDWELHTSKQGSKKTRHEAVLHTSLVNAVIQGEVQDLLICAPRIST